MPQVKLIFVGAALLFLLSRILVKKWLTRRRALAQGCLPPPDIKSERRPQMTILREAMAAVKDERGPQFIISRMDRISPDCHTAYVPILGSRGMFITRDPENIMAMYKNTDFDISASREATFLRLVGRGVLTNRGEAWRQSRALVRPQFAKDIIGDLGAKERHLNALMGRMPQADPTTGWTSKVDVQPLLFRYCLDTTTELLYAQSADSLSSPEDSVEKDLFAHFGAAKDWIEEHGLLAKFAWLFGGTRDLDRHCKTVHDFVDVIVERHLQRKRDGQNEKQKPRFSLLDELSKVTSDPLVLRSETLQLLSASKDTIACLTSWAVYHLARNPESYRRLRAAVAEACVGTPGDDGGLRALQECEYLQWVINETLRVAAILPMNDRVALRDGVLPRGGGPDGTAPVYVPEGTRVLISIYAVQHRRDLWGPDADEFRPERWDGLKPGWEFLPFSSGRRKCLGQQLARTEAAYFLSRFCQRYDAIENAEEGPNRLRLHTAIETKSGSGVQVRLHEAS